MATLVLSAAGAALGGAMGGSVLGISAAVLGRAAGAVIGNVIDQRLLGAGSQVVQAGRASSLRLMAGGEGNAIARVFGRMRVSGQVIWSTRFRETSKTTGSGKGLAPSQPEVRSFSYSISFALGLCEGEIVRVGRVWADGKRLKQKHLSMRVYTGGEGQLPDPLIEAVEGAANAPAFRGLAYLVFEDLPLAAYGNRIPQISAEVFRRVSAPHVAELVSAVALVPGTGEYALATAPVHYPLGKGKRRSANAHSSSGRADIVESLRQLDADLPNCGAVSLVVSWFGDDLRCDRCTLTPRVEQKDTEGSQVWSVGGLTRSAARTVSVVGGRPAFGGTPSDASVIQAISHLKDSGKKVMFYPFVLMDIQAGNGLIDPWTGEAGQPAAPWRGRITLSAAPGRPGSVDQTEWAAVEVAELFGLARPNDFQPRSDGVDYAGPDEWSLRRFVLHYAHLCVVAGGVDVFCLGSELRGLTQIRSGAEVFPAVDRLRDLAADVRAIVGPGCKISYAADWSEYFGYHPEDGSGDVLFHLDPLWADANVDFIGIDNYLPLSDWRNGASHLDADWGSICNPDYLRANIEGGEGFDWYYETLAKRELQLRTPIADEGYGEHWVWRPKDFRGWWLNPHHNRIGGVRSAAPTAWAPQSKPVAFTELGCPAVNNGSNQPNMFADAKSAESGLPWFSDGGRDDLMQQAYLEAMLGYWSDPANNPVAAGFAGRMVDMARAFVWAWDARPWPEFPALTGVWSDGGNYARGHWLNGRAADVTLAQMVGEVCAPAGEVDVSGLFGVVKGYTIAAVETGRQSLQPLMLAHGFDAFERDGALVFASRSARPGLALDASGFVVEDDGAAFQAIRAGDGDSSGRVRVTFVRDNGDYASGTVEVADALAGNNAVSASEFALVLDAGEGQKIAERWISEAAVSRDQIAFALPPSRLAVTAGDVVSVAVADQVALYRIDRVESAGPLQVEAVRIEAGIYARQPVSEELVTGDAAPEAAAVFAEWLDLPLLGSDAGGARIAVSADPWPGAVSVYSAAEDDGYVLNATVESRSVAGETLETLAAGEAGRWQRGEVRVRIWNGELASRSADQVLNGANVAALRPAGAEDWEIFQFQTAELVAPGEYRLQGLLRGQAGTEFLGQEAVLAGADFVQLDGSAARIALADSLRGLPRHYRVGPAAEPYDDDSYAHEVWLFRDIGARPYAPAHLRAARQADGSISISWIRRTRLDGDSWEGREAPLNEVAELYHLRIADGSRELEIGEVAFSYGPAQQAADGVSGSFAIEVAQISERFGAGPYARIMFNG